MNAKARGPALARGAAGVSDRFGGEWIGQPATSGVASGAREPETPIESPHGPHGQVTRRAPSKHTTLRECDRGLDKFHWSNFAEELPRALDGAFRGEDTSVDLFHGRTNLEGDSRFKEPRCARQDVRDEKRAGRRQVDVVVTPNEPMQFELTDAGRAETHTS